MSDIKVRTGQVWINKRNPNHKVIISHKHKDRIWQTLSLSAQSKHGSVTHHTEERTLLRQFKLYDINT